MSSLAAPVTRVTLADLVVPRTWVTNTLLVIGGAVFTGLLAQVAVPLWPVPITGQTLAVMLVASTLGLVRGTLSMLVYAVLGVVGVPWFSGWSGGPSILHGPTGGYIVGFNVAAAIVGWSAERGGDRRILRAVATFLVATISVFAVGLPWLAFALGTDLQQTLEFGLYPFIVGGLVKALLAALIIPAAWWVQARRK
jgi:biotin transport system substrate-specific component